MGPEGVERKLAAILSADVVGYSRLMAEDEAGTVGTLTAYRDVVGMLVHQHRGRVVDSPGDNLLAEFRSALEAVEAAIEIQRVIKARNTAVPADRKMEFRIGIHLGDVVVEGERIYGDGVNIAARLEGLAEPGGICVSGTIHEQVQRKLDLGYDDLGKQELKNIPDPVQAYRARVEPEADVPTESLPGMDELTVAGFGGRPAIAVLPFENLSGDPDQEYFVDGIAEDLITRLSDWRYFPVIARNSSFVYKGQAVQMKQVNQELGARYIVEGSVRKAGNRVRISAQLIDATTGHHIWAERYDRELSNIFALQDEITEAIVASMYPDLWQSEWRHALRQRPERLDVWDYVMRGNWHVHRFTADDNAKARLLYEKAAELDPHFALAFLGLATKHYNDLLFQWTDAPGRSIAELLHTARMSVALDDKNPTCHLALGWAYSFSGEQDKMIAALEVATQLNPSLSGAYFYLATYLALAGRPDDAIAKLGKAMRLSPRDPAMWRILYGMAIAHAAAGRHEEAVDWAQRSLQHKPDFALTFITLASSYTYLGRSDEARAAVQGLLQVNPEFSLTGLKRMLSAAHPALAQRIIDALRRAGLPEE